jgi:peptidyl-prolyl cis-trans isomerase C
MKSLSTDEVRAYYDAHRDKYQQPEQFRLQMIFFKVEPGAEAKVRREAEAARNLLSEKKSGNAFDNFARLRSDDSISKMHGGDLGFQSREELEQSLGKAVADEATRLVVPDDLSKVVAGPNGLYLLKLEARKPAFNQTFEQSEKAVRRLVWTERRNEVFDAFMKKLLADADIKIDDSELAKIRFDHPDTATDQPPQPAADDEDPSKAF